MVNKCDFVLTQLKYFFLNILHYNTCNTINFVLHQGLISIFSLITIHDYHKLADRFDSLIALHGAAMRMQ
jgi:hypothetical protein